MPWLVRHFARAALLDRGEYADGRRRHARISNGRYWARTSDPQLVDSGQRSRQFAWVRSDRTVEPNLNGDRTLERTRTNADPCHSCHAPHPSILVQNSELKS